MSVAELLQASIAAHKASIPARQKRDLATSFGLLMQAYQLRVAAHALDPEHADMAWAEEQKHTMAQADTHAELMAFYEQQFEANGR